jgi:hypothetical protein
MPALAQLDHNTALPLDYFASRSWRTHSLKGWAKDLSRCQRVQSLLAEVMINPET